MSSRLEIHQWIYVGHPVYAVSLSGDGQYIAAGTEQGVVVFNVAGHQLLTYPSTATPMPVHRLAASADLRRLYIGTRQGWLIPMDMERDKEGFRHRARKPLCQTDNDLHTVALSANGEFIALGHLSPALAVFQSDGDLLWRRHPDDGTATEGRMWAVALDAEGTTLYVGSAGSETNRLAALEARTGSPRAHRYLEARVTGIAALADQSGVAAVLTESPYSSHLVVYSTDLAELVWECSFDEPITTLVADSKQPILAVGTGYEGRIALMDAKTGQMLTSDLTFKSLINGLAVVQGRILAAATQDGHLALIRYLAEEFRL